MPVGGRFDDITLANRIANHDLNGNAARTPDANATDRLLNVADYWGKPDAPNIGFDLD